MVLKPGSDIIVDDRTAITQPGAEITLANSTEQVFTNDQFKPGFKLSQRLLFVNGNTNVAKQVVIEHRRE